MTIREIQIAQDARERKLEPVRDFTPAVLIFVDSSALDAKVEGYPDLVWAKEYNQPESAFRILNRATSPTVGLQVKIGWPEKPPFQRQVIGLWDEIQNLTSYDPGDGGSLSSHPHAQSHQLPTPSTPGTDPVLIFQPAIQLLKTTGDAATLTITIQGLPSYRLGNILKEFNGTTVDLTASVPGVGLKRKVLVYLDAATNTIVTVDGTTVPDVVAIPSPEPALPDDGIASAYVELANGQTTIVTATNVTDAREFLEPRASIASLLTATAPGQILISNDGVTLELGVPIVDANGDIITDLNGFIMVV